jgi:hypothetical protein
MFMHINPWFEPLVPFFHLVKSGVIPCWEIAIEIYFGDETLLSFSA